MSFWVIWKKSRQSERPPSSGRRFRRAGSERFLRTKPVLSEVPTAREARIRRIEDRTEPEGSFDCPYVKAAVFRGCLSLT